MLGEPLLITMSREETVEFIDSIGKNKRKKGWIKRAWALSGVWERKIWRRFMLFWRIS